MGGAVATGLRRRVSIVRAPRQAGGYSTSHRARVYEMLRRHLCTALDNRR